MVGRRWSLCVVLVLVAALVVPLVAQDRGGRGRGMGGMGRFQNMSEEERAQFRARMVERRLTRLKGQLEVSDEEWTVVSEPIEAIFKLQTDEAEAARELRRAVSAEGATTEQLKSALEAYRKTTKEIAQKRAKLQKELQSMVTLRQEALLVLAGVLD